MLDLKLKILSSKPLTFVNEKNQKKEAVSVFKLVQIYMSDRKAKVENDSNKLSQLIITHDSLIRLE